MKKTIKAGALLLAGVFVLSGCGSSDGDSGSAEAESSPAPTLAVGQDQYSADELEDALVAVTEDGILTGDVENDAMLRPQFEDASYTDISIEPEKCAALLSSTFDRKIQEGNLAFGGVNDSDVLTLVSYDDASVLEEQVEGSETAVADCAQIQMANGEAELAASLEKIEASTEAPTTQAYRTTIDRIGSEGTAIHVIGISGTVQVSVSLFDPADEDAAIADAEEAIDAVYAELESK
ncbi:MULTISPECIES: hypothetical protein [unclassified Arthrobacter]|uniref:hypothetical protein n=1 Tax=unclassified Arthrobacter TaxID=235627 RepID=UPI0021050B96|nr:MULTISPECIES: hypothetical protein [unclassified Arthrobacter]MCQ1948000.1 hypothetical protein [Arthrobacter sp. zg-Y1116]MCQ1987939.1 hypothetical protein [Arthrobacter sp. zg-Y844]MCQ1996094.1 hypothetical protein [Arthrobacter sp. zg-Y1171]UWX82839.1 hypothetical protein N2L00_05355 [Arthrobacter sp. zg-Y1171]